MSRFTYDDLLNSLGLKVGSKFRTDLDDTMIYEVIRARSEPDAEGTFYGRPTVVDLEGENFELADFLNEEITLFNINNYAPNKLEAQIVCAIDLVYNWLVKVADGRIIVYENQPDFISERHYWLYEGRCDTLPLKGLFHWIQVNDLISLEELRAISQAVLWDED